MMHIQSEADRRLLAADRPPTGTRLPSTALRLLLAATLMTGTWGLPGKAWGQSTRPDPMDARAHVPPAVHRSALKKPERAGEAEAAPDARTWRSANEQVTAIGGWRTYAREAAAGNGPAPLSAPAAPSASAARAPAPVQSTPPPQPQPRNPHHQHGARP